MVSHQPKAGRNEPSQFSILDLRLEIERFLLCLHFSLLIRSLILKNQYKPSVAQIKPEHLSCTAPPLNFSGRAFTGASVQYDEKPGFFIG
jgi:hypothetical protein